MAKKDYLDRHEFHAELAACKHKNELSRKAIDMFTILSTEVSKKYYFKYEADRDDAIASAVYDCYKYWRNFKESNVVQLKILRNFFDRESLALEIENHGTFVYVAKTEKQIIHEFKIDETPNKTIDNLIGTIDKGTIGVYHDKVKCKITFMDFRNGAELTIKSKLILLTPVSYCKKTPLTNTKTKTENVYEFNEPPNGFSYFTSVVDKGILKSINKLNPKNLRNGVMVSLSHINNTNNGNGLFNL